jgi:hypothetical protein
MSRIRFDPYRTAEKIIVLYTLISTLLAEDEKKKGPGFNVRKH